MSFVTATAVFEYKGQHKKAMYAVGGGLAFVSTAGASSTSDELAVGNGGGKRIACFHYIYTVLRSTSCTRHVYSLPPYCWVAHLLFLCL